MHILWILHGAIARSGDAITSKFASARYRGLIPARALTEQGHEVAVLGAELGQAISADALDARGRPDVVVLSKSFSQDSEALVRRAQGQGSAVIVDLCDNHFDHRALGPFYRTLCALADHVTVSTSAMADVVATRANRRGQVVDDPYEGPQGEASFDPAPGRLKLSWFGNLVNIDSILLMMTDLVALSRHIPLALDLVTASRPDLVAACAQWTRQLSPAMTVRLTPWTLSATWAALAEADLVVIPSAEQTAQSPDKTVKSPNRMVEALRAGRFVAAHPLPAYQELGAYAWVDADLIAGIHWALDHRQAAVARIASGQSTIAERFAPEVVAGQWADAFEHAIAARSARRSAASISPADAGAAAR